MKKQLWNKVTSVALSLAMAVTMLPTTPVGAATDVSTKTNVLSWVGEIAYNKDTGNTKATTTSVSDGLTVDATTNAWRTAITADTSNMTKPKVQINRTNNAGWDTWNFCFMDDQWNVLAGEKDTAAIAETSLEIDMPVAEDATVYAYVLDESITSIYVWDDAANNVVDTSKEDVVNPDKNGYMVKVDGEFASFDGETDYSAIAWTDTTPYAQKVAVKNNQVNQVTIDFGVPVSFTGNFIGFETEIPYDVANEYELVAIAFDEGAYIAPAATVATNEGIDGNTRLTLINQWNPDIETQPYGADVWNGKTFQKITVQFKVNIAKHYTAKVDGEFASFDGETDYSAIAWTDTTPYAQDVAVINGKEASATIDFGAPVSFTGNFIGFETDIPYSDGSEYKLVSIAFDDEDAIAPAATVATSEGIDGNTRLTLINQWNPDIETQPYGANVWNGKTFQKITVKFVVNLAKSYIAKVDGEFASFNGETDYSAIAWTDTTPYAQNVEVINGKEASVTIDFGVPVSFTGNFIGFETDIPFSESAKYELVSIAFDDEDAIVPAATVATSEGIDGNTRLTLINQWNPDIVTQPYGANVWNGKTFQKITVKFIVDNITEYVYDMFDETVKYRVDVEVEGEGGSASADVENNKAIPGDTVTVSVIAYSGYELKEIVVLEPEGLELSEGNTFIMPEKDVKIKVVFDKKAAEEDTKVEGDLTETAFDTQKITASNNYQIKSTDYPKNPVKVDLDIELSKYFWNDWSQFFFKVDYDGKTKYYVFAGDQAGWNTTVGLLSDEKGADAYIVPVSGTYSEAKGEHCVDNYEIIKLPSTDKYYVKDEEGKQVYDDDKNPVLTDDAYKTSLTIKEIAGCDDWTVTCYCPAWSKAGSDDDGDGPIDATVADPDGTSKDLMKQLTDEYDEEGKKTGNLIPVITDEADAWVYAVSGKVTTSKKAVDKLVEPDVAGPAKGKKLSDKKYKYVVVTPGKTDGSLDGTVQVIGLKKKSLKTIKIASSVKIGGVKYNVVSIKKNAFKKNKKVKTVKIGKNVETIGANAFAKMKKLKKVTINSTKLTTIGNGAFSGDKKLTSVVIKSMKLKKIGKKAFYGDKKLKTVKISSRILKTVGKKAFAKTKKKATFKVPSLKIADYKKKFKKAGAKKAKVKAL